jgi:hypothetical protein
MEYSVHFCAMFFLKEEKILHYFFLFRELSCSLEKEEKKIKLLKFCCL